MFSEMVEEKRGMLLKLLEYLDKPEVPLPKLTQVSGLRTVSEYFFSLVGCSTGFAESLGKGDTTAQNDTGARMNGAVEAGTTSLPELSAIRFRQMGTLAGCSI